MNNEKLFNDIKEEIMNNLERFGEKIKQLLIRQVKEILESEKKVVTSNLLKSIDGEVMRIQTGILVQIFSGTGYAFYVHEGTKPHFPPVYALRDWVKLKGLAYRNSRKKILNYKSMNDYWIINNIAYAIAWKIYRNGTQGLKFFDLALKQAEPKINEMINNFKIT